MLLWPNPIMISLLPCISMLGGKVGRRRRREEEG